MRLTVHRATQTIGGNCIELAAGGRRVILDVGRPLDAPRDGVGLLPSSLDLAVPTAGLLISQRLQSWFDSGKAKADHIHTSGHASTADLKTFAMAMRAKRLIPIHGLNWDTAGDQFPGLVRLRDGEPLEL